MVLLLVFTLPAFATSEQQFKAESNITATDTTEASQSSSVKSPKGVKAKAISSSEIKIGWKKVSGADGYHIYYSLNKKGPFLPFDGTQDWIGEYSSILYDIPANTTVYFKVTTVKNGKESKYSNVVKATTMTAGPELIVSEPDSDNIVGLQWSSIAGADYYYIYYSNNGVNFTPIIKNNGKKARYDWTTKFSGYSALYHIPDDATTYFKVTYVKKGKESDFGNIVKATALY